MEKRNFSLIAAEINKQVEQIEGVLKTLLERDAAIAKGQPAVVEGAAFHVHNYYNAVEDLLKIVAAAFENNITDASRWHSELIDRMAMDIEGVRPRLISAETAALLHRLRSFRHFFRHAYRVTLDESEIRLNIERVKEIHPDLLADVRRFLKTLQTSE